MRNLLMFSTFNDFALRSPASAGASDDGAAVFVAPGAMSPDAAKAKAEEASKAAAAMQAEAEKIAADAAQGVDTSKPPEPYDAQINVRGALKVVKVRNRTYGEYFDDMARRFLGYSDPKTGIKVAGEVESGDPAVARYAKDMLAMMAISAGGRNAAMPGDVVPVNPDDIR